MTIAVVDGLGGGLGAQLVERLKAALGDRTRIIALGTNSSATERMLKAGAERGASGENAIKASIGLGDLVMGPIGIVVPNGLMGEISPAIAEAIFSARGRLILVPVQQPHFVLAGLPAQPMSQLVNAAVEAAREALGAAEAGA